MVDEFYKKLGEALKTERTAHGYSMTDVAEYLHVHRTSVMRWERGEMEMSAKSLMDYLQFLHIKSDEFIRKYKL